MEGEIEIVKMVLMFEEGALKGREEEREICLRNIDFLYYMNCGIPYRKL